MLEQMSRASRKIIARFLISATVLSVAVVLGWRSADQGLWRLIESLSPGVLAAVIVALALNLLMAAFRFSILSAHYGTRFRLREVVAIVSASNVAGALFFQIAGQIMARGAMIARLGGSASTAVMITTNERIAAALVSLVGAAIGALIVFGHIYVDLNAGGSAFAKLIVVSLLATCLGILLSGAAPFILPSFSARAARIWLLSCLLSIGVQLPMMAAYIVAAKALAPALTVVSIFGAALVVMFAASVPISFGGWGVRELSAVAALGAIGLPPAKALLVALMIGVGSMLVAGLGAAATLPSLLLQAPRKPVQNVRERQAYSRMLLVAVPVVVAIAVVFQIHIPVNGNQVNVNLADPFVLVGGLIFLVRLATSRESAHWRYRYVNVAALLAVVVLTISLFLGAERFGLTPWAVTNRYVGWFILMAYAATGALIVAEQSTLGAFIIARAYLAAIATVASVEIALAGINLFHRLGPELIVPDAIEGMAQNRNAFAFQLLVALALAIGLRLYRRSALAAATAITAITIVLTFSRSGLITFAALVVLSVLTRAAHARLVAAMAAVSVVVALIAYSVFGARTVVSQIMIDSSNLSERLVTLEGGLRLFRDHPVFGAGLGAFQNEGYKSINGLPLVIHSTFVWLLAETGLAGFGLFVFGAGYVLKRELATLNSDRVSATILLLVTVMVIMGLPADMLYQRTFWLFIGALLAIPITSSARGWRSPQLGGATEARAGAFISLKPSGAST